MKRASKRFIKRLPHILLPALLLFTFSACSFGAAEKTEDCSCTISISCAAILDHMGLCDKDKTDFVPADGVILGPTEAHFSEGESVFDVLQRVCRENKIHMEFSDTPIYNSAYIEGIGNLYEFDAGALSGWMYSVNGWFPNYGCSNYELQDGDTVCWVYSCELGDDVGGGFAKEKTTDK